MKALVQRVSEARIGIADQTVAEIGAGILVLLCVEAGDTVNEADRLADKIAKLRIFGDADGKMNLSIGHVGGAAMVVSQFILAADTRRGNRPSFVGAAAPAEAKPLVDRFCTRLRAAGIPVETGRFGARMAVALVNDGPVTIWLDTRNS